MKVTLVEYHSLRFEGNVVKVLPPNDGLLVSIHGSWYGSRFHSDEIALAVDVVSPKV